MAPTPLAKRRKLDLSEEFKVIVGTGNQQRTFTVQKAFLTKSSDFFRKACNGTWKENETKTITLPEQIADTFEIYLQWVYTGELVVTDEETPCKTAEFAQRNEFTQRTNIILVNCYTLGDMLMDASLRNDVVDSVVQFKEATGVLPNSCTVDKGYSSTPKDCKLRTLLVDFYAAPFDRRAQWVREHGEGFNKSFLIDVLAKMYSERDGKTLSLSPKAAPKCTYHDHNDDNPQCA